MIRSAANCVPEVESPSILDDDRVLQHEVPRSVLGEVAFARAEEDRYEADAHLVDEAEFARLRPCKPGVLTDGCPRVLLHRADRPLKRQAGGGITAFREALHPSSLRVGEPELSLRRQRSSPRRLRCLRHLDYGVDESPLSDEEFADPARATSQVDYPPDPGPTFASGWDCCTIR